MEKSEINAVTVVPADKIIIVNGQVLHFSFSFPEGMHALQWKNGQGHIEWEEDLNWPLCAEAYDEEVAPFVRLWEAEKDRLDILKQEADAAYASTEARFSRLRLERDRRIQLTDFAAMPDYPVSEENRQSLFAYRQALRDLPAQAGAPWDGGGDATPWPALPALLQLTAYRQGTAG